MTTRRQFLQGVAAGGLFPAPAIVLSAAAAPAPVPVPILNNGVRLDPPKFDDLASGAKAIVGVRPHRTGGICLKSDHPINTSQGKKIVIHNYGHSGAGITLSWGCASYAADLVQNAVTQLRAMNLNPSVAVLGSGVIGLTSATEVRLKFPDLPIKIYAASLDANLDVKKTTSYVAGGQFEPSQIFREYGPDKRTLAGYLERSATRIRGILSSGRGDDFGIRPASNFTLDYPEDGFNVYTPCDVIPPYKKGQLPFNPLRPHGPALNLPGREYSTWLLNPHIMLPQLVKELQGPHTQFESRMFDNIQQVHDLPENIVINCTGYGAKKLFRDDNVVPRRGHLMVLDNPATADLRYLFSGGSVNNAIFYLFARQKDIVIGGTVQQSNDDRVRLDNNDRTICNRILANARRMFDGQPAQCVNPLNGLLATRQFEADPGACLDLPHH